LESSKRIIPAGEFVYLDGPKPRTFEFIFALKVLKEFIKGFRVLHFMGPAITVFGGARYKPGHLYYEKGFEIGKRIAELGFVTVTGGGPGIMEAANKGAFENGGKICWYQRIITF
jgi:hypothetical protein